MVVRHWIALLVALVLAPAAQAASLGVAWDPSDEPGVTGYRVYVGTSPGHPSEFFDVGPFQTSFLYAAAIEGREYYFSVATRAGSVIGAASEEVWGTARFSVSGTFKGVGAASRSADLPRQIASAGPSLFPLGGGLAAVSSMVFSPEGMGFFIEGGRTIRRLAPGELSVEPALEAGADERFLSLAVDPRFAATGHVYVVIEAMTAGGRAEVRVVRHRLAGLLLGEAATVINGLAPAATALAVTPAGHILVAQPGRLLRFGLDGTVPRDQAGGSPMWAPLDVQPEVAVWDAARNGLWVVGREASGAVAARFVEDGSVVRTPELKSPNGPVVEQVAATIVSGRAQAHVSTATGLSSIDLATGSSLGLRVSSIAGRVVSGTIAPAGDVLVVVETAPQGASPAHSLLRSFSDAPPPGAREVLSRLP